MDDREMLEWAAKAVGGEFSPGTAKHRIGETWEEWEWIGPQGITGPCFIGTGYPLTDDGDALRLAVKLGIDIHLEGRADERAVWADDVMLWVDGDALAATRRAIVMAASKRAAQQSKGDSRD